MEFNQKLQELRKQKGLTQEELAQQLYVSRTAVSKWESNRGYPSIDSLKHIAEFFSVTIDQLLSADELMTAAENDNIQKEKHIYDIIFGLLDISVALLFFLPLFGQSTGDVVYAVSLFKLISISPYIKTVYFVLVLFFIIYGTATLALQNIEAAFWVKNKNNISLTASIAGTFIFMISRQVYAAALLFIFSVIKAFIVTKHR